MFQFEPPQDGSSWPSLNDSEQPEHRYKPRGNFGPGVSKAVRVVSQNQATVTFTEDPKVEELQMDWLRSEDLKEEKGVTASLSL